MELVRISWKVLIAASAVGVVMSAAFCVFESAETVPLALMVAPLYGLSIGGVMILQRFSESRSAALAAFVWPVLLVLGLVFHAVSADAEIVRATGVSEGATEISLYILKVYAAGLIPAATALHLALLTRSWAE